MSVVTIQVGPKNAYTSPESGLRMYRWQGRDLPSVTSVRRMAGVPFGLVNWQIGKVVGRAVERHDELTAMLTRERKPRERVLEANRKGEAAKWLRAAAVEERDAAAALGTAVHDAAAEGKSPDAVDDEVRPRLVQYLDWLRVSEAEVLLAERQVFNLTIGYAGTFDLVCRFPSGRSYLVDIKTGSGIYGEHLGQLLAYLMAEHVGEDDVVDEAATAILRSVSGIGILHLADDRWEFVFPRETELGPAWTAFRGLHAFATWTAAHGSAASWIETKRVGSASVREVAA